MHRFFKKISRRHQDQKLLLNELGLAHLVIVLLSIGMIGLLILLSSQTDVVDDTLAGFACGLLAVVVLISGVITTLVWTEKK